MAQTKHELSLKWDGNFNANLEIYMARVNSEKMFDLQICTPSIQNWKCQPKDDLCPTKFCTTFILVEFWVFRQKLENAAKVLEWDMDIQEFDPPS
jgi:hypothetical protein